MTGPRFISVLALPRDVFPKPPAQPLVLFLSQTQIEAMARVHGVSPSQLEGAVRSISTIPVVTYEDMKEAVAKLEMMNIPPIKCSKCGRGFYTIIPGTMALGGSNSAPLHDLPTTCADCS